MRATHAVLGCESSSEKYRFALTTRPIRYIDRFLQGGEVLRWAVPARNHGEALALRDRWNSARAPDVVKEVARLSAPPEVIRELLEIWWNGGRPTEAEAEALAMIEEHGEFGLACSVRDAGEALDEDVLEPPHVCPFVPLPERCGPSPASTLIGADLGINLAIFDLDMTLVDSSKLKDADSRRRWESGVLPLEHVRALPCWGGCAAHELPALLSAHGVRIALISRAPRRYVDKVVKRFDIYSDLICAPCGPNKYGAFKDAMERFGAPPAKTVVFGDDRSDFQAASLLDLLSLGNPWTSTKAFAAPDVAWLHVSPLIEQGGWHKRLRYIGESELEDAEWHRGSLLPFGDDAFALGRYFPTKHQRHYEASTQRILASKENLSGDPYVLAAFETVIQRLVARTDIDIVLSVPPHRHLGKEDRFSAYRQIITDISGASDSPHIDEVRRMPGDYKFRSHDKRRELRKGSLAIRDNLDGLTVLLIDDVVTSGATLLALKDAAKQAGASKVIQLAFGFNQSVQD